MSGTKPVMPGITLGSELANLRKRVDKSCEYCGGPITGLKTKKYCGEPCKQKAKYARKKSAKN